MKPSRLNAWIMQTEGLSSLTRESLREMQLARLNALLAREKARGGFYRVLPEKLSSLDELRSLPFTTAEDLKAHGASMLLTSQSEVARVITDQTSGTQGAVKRVFYTEGDLQHTVGFFMAGLGELVFPGDRVMIAMPFSGRDGLGELIARAIEGLGAVPLAAGVGKSYGALREMLNTERPSVYVGMPVPLLSLLRYAGESSLRRALVSADATPQSVMVENEMRLNSKLFPHYGAREMGLGGAVTCPAHAGMHLRENHIIAEIVDKDGHSLPPGERGELVVTTIGMEALPLIRYRTGDSARYLDVPCACGGVCGRLTEVSRIASGLDAATLDEHMFRVPALIDYSARIQGGALELGALTKGAADIGALERAAKACCPQLAAHVSARPVREDDIAGGVGKRSLR